MMNDALETPEELFKLYEVLQSVTDSKGRPACFTANTIVANPDFERIRESNYKNYYYEPFTKTYLRTKKTENSFAAFQEGMAHRLFQPQLHGREHVNIELFERKLRRRDPALAANLEQQCLAGLEDESDMPGVGFTHAFGLYRAESIEQHREILAEGLDLFEKVWGFRSRTFTPPAQRLHPSLFADAVRGGVRAIDKPLHCIRRLGDAQSAREINRSGRQRGQGHVTVVRNVVFEPGKDMGFDPVERALQQVAAAFRWRRPAIISSHRVNFCGHLEEANRKHGLEALRILLEKITARWPDVEFVSVDKLVEQMDQPS